MTIDDDDKENGTTAAERLNNAFFKQTLPEVVKTDAEKATEDYEFTRKKLKNLVNIGEEALEHFFEIAQETNEPRAFEVLATLLKTTGELSKGISDNAKTKSSIDKDRGSIQPEGNQPSSLTQNNIYVGTTKDLLKQLKAQDDDIIEG